MSKFSTKRISQKRTFLWRKMENPLEYFVLKRGLSKLIN
jgi:hypothetical protein